MRTAEEFLYANEITEKSLYFSRALTAINEARKEAIEECKLIMYDYDIDSAAKKMNNLIKELK